jgi:enterochelin esterase family protein
MVPNVSLVDEPALGPRVDHESGDVVFTTDATGGIPTRVWYHLRDFGDDPTFQRRGERWQAHVPAPPVDRIEYLIVRRDESGMESLTLDPAAPARATGVFGDHSLLELPGYCAPSWAESDDWRAWRQRSVRWPTNRLGVEIAGSLMCPTGVDDREPVPLLVVHDGSEYARLADLLDYLGWLAEQQPETRCRVLLLEPVNRNQSYAANTAYTDTLVHIALPEVRRLAPTRTPLVALGASLGALALVHAEAMYPGTFGGILAQSGSFFVPRYDAHERRFAQFDRVVRATRALYEHPERLAGCMLRFTAGLGEENLDNNRALAERFAAAGVDATLTTGRDGHNFTAWRDLLHPALADLLAHSAAA